jgi:hypothetical protein
MRYLTTIIFTFYSLIVCSQTFKEMTPILGYFVDKSSQGEIDFIKQLEQCEKFWLAHPDNFDESKFTAEEKKLYELCSTDIEGYWDIIGVGCSWYCGGGQDTNSASSSLKPFEGIDYSANNIHDLNYNTAWIEGVSGYGIGEFITYHFPPENPRITEIIIVNGFVKSEKSWKDNSRVKKLKMYIDDKPFAILNLADSRQEQHFKFEPLGYSDRQDWEELQKKPWWTIKFEILDVYKGDKYDDTAITEIYFDGIDVH